MTNSEAQDALRRFAGTRDPAAFERLVKGHIDLVYAAARRQVSDPATADDVTQQVFVLLANKAGKLSDAVRLPGWLLRTCRHCASDANRARLRRLHHEQEAAAMKSQTASIDPDTQEILRQVDAALAVLGETDRTAIAMRYLQQRSVREIADALKVTEDAAKKRLSRAMERLRGRLAPLRTAITVTAVAAVLEQAASITAPPAMASTVATTAVASKVAVGGGFTIHGIAAWKIGVVVAVILLAAGGVAVWILNGPSSQPIAVNPAVPTTEAVKLLLMPTVASLTPQQLRVYELLYQFRNEVPPQRPEEWIATLREITQIGAPAVPALCVELDRTSSDGKQRLLIMALRIIDDPRAVPSLIRALPRVAQVSSDYGFNVSDPDLREFLDSHYWDTSTKYRDPRFSFFNRGITECIAALEAITHHSEGHGPIMDTPGRSSQQMQEDRKHPPTTQELAQREAQYQGELAAQLERRQQFAAQWQQWWAEHGSGADMETVDAARYDGDLVAAVGAATAPPFFPTGPQIHLTPLREMDVPTREPWDAPAYLNFSTGRLFCQDEDRSDTDRLNESRWFHDEGIDAFCGRGETYDANRKHNNASALKDTGGFGHYAELWSIDMKIWPTINARFDNIDQEIEQTKPLNLGTDRPRTNLSTNDSPNTPQQYPATFFFQTRHNRYGILQIVKTINEETGVRIRYRLWPETAIGKSTSQPATQPAEVIASGLKFDESHELTLAAPESGQPAAVNLKTDQTYRQEVDLDKPSAWSEAKDDWADKTSTDLLTIDGQAKEIIGLVTPSKRLIAVPITDGAWDQMSAETCAAIASRAKRYGGFNLNWLTARKTYNPDGPSSTWIVCSRKTDDLLGIVQITDLQPEALKLRYKLVEVPAAK